MQEVTFVRPVEGDCVLWTGPVGSKGYGLLKKKRNGTRLAHRVAWEEVHGPIPDGLHIDHLCRVKLCIRPGHLEPVTPAENNRRKPAQVGGRPKGVASSVCGNWHDASETHCRHGHEYVPANTYVGPNGLRQCRQCRRDAWKRSYRKAAA